MADSVIIADGMTLDGYLPASKGVHPEVRFKFRPAFPTDAYEYKTADKSTGRKMMAATSKLLVKYLVEWDVVRPSQPGKDSQDPVPINEATLAATHWIILEGIGNFILGYVSAEQMEEDRKNS